MFVIQHVIYIFISWDSIYINTYIFNFKYNQIFNCKIKSIHRLVKGEFCLYICINL